MSGSLNGATRLYPIVGDPVAQVKSPRALGCRTATGVDMFRVAQGLIVGFLLDG